MWFSLFYQPLVNALIFFYNLMGGNLGWAIIGLTIAIRLLLTPLTLPSLKSAQKLKTLQPELNKLKEKFGGKVPHTMEEILTIPGVARKTGNVVLGNAYGVVEGIAVDTHVRRIANILGLTASDNPIIIERDLMALIPKKDWFKTTYLFIEYGRKYCPAKRHDHAHCPLAAFHAKI